MRRVVKESNGILLVFKGEDLLEVYSPIKNITDIYKNENKNVCGYDQMTGNIVEGVLKIFDNKKGYDAEGGIISSDFAIVYPEREFDNCTHAGYNFNSWQGATYRPYKRMQVWEKVG